MTPEDRSQVVTMVRARNEERWMWSLLERAFRVSETVVILDDASDSRAQEQVCMNYVGPMNGTRGSRWAVWIGASYEWDGLRDELHYIRSPFRLAGWHGPCSSRNEVNPNEIRDREFLWEYVKAQTNAKYVLCLDGDEMLSNQAIRAFPNIISVFRQDLADIIIMPFIYLWDGGWRRVDGWYGDKEDGAPFARFPRVFSLEYLTTQQLKMCRFTMTGNFLHCGSIPLEYYAPHMSPPRHAFARASIIHFGYIDKELRQSKYERYTQMDPDNEEEGFYLHLIGKPNKHCPGEVTLVPYHDK